MKLKALPTLFLQALLVATAATLAIVLVTRFVTPVQLSTSQVTTQKDKAFAVNGKSVVSTRPDKVEVTLGVSRKETNIKTAQTQANQIVQNITQKLMELGINKDDIKTQNYSIYPTYDYQRATQDIVGYSVDVSMIVSIKEENFEKLNQAVDAATAAGANQVGGINFALSEEKEREVRAQAREEAIKDARANADELAKLSGLKLGKVINVSEWPDVATPIPYARDMAAQGGGGGAPTNIQPGSTNYNYNVTLSYETL